MLYFARWNLIYNCQLGQMRRLTRVFVRRQANRFKAQDAEIHWFEAGEGKVKEIEKGIRAFLEET